MSCNHDPPQTALPIRFALAATNRHMLVKRRKKSPQLPQTIQNFVSAAQNLPVPVCCVCRASSPASDLFVCLSCPQTICRAHLQLHAHKLVLNLDRTALFCANCNKYVCSHAFHSNLLFERSRLNTIVAKLKEPSIKKLIHPQYFASQQHLFVIKNNSSPLACAGLRGLRNLGSTCFMNSILQSFMHNPLLRAHFLSERHSKTNCVFPDAPCLACELDSLFQQFYAANGNPIAPTSFLYAVWKSQRHLAVYQQQDAHEFFISVLNQIHNCCSGGISSPVDLSRSCKCIIHQVFGGVLQSDVTCLKCGNITTTTDPILDISLDIKQSSKTVKKSITKKPIDSVATNSDANTVMSLIDCLDTFTHPERLGINQYTCSSCTHPVTEATKQLSLKRLPPVLAIQLKRFEQVINANGSGLSWIKIGCGVKVPMVLDMTPHTTRSVKLRSKKSGLLHGGNTPAPLSSSVHVYSLFAVISHTGTRLDTGHYITYIRHRDAWYMCDDDKVVAVETHVISDVSVGSYMCMYVRGATGINGSLSAEYVGKHVVEGGDVENNESDVEMTPANN